MADDVMRQGGTRYVLSSMRGGVSMEASEIRRWAHPIETAQDRPGQNNCESMQAILCALAGQNQVLCAIKAELDEIYAILRENDAESSTAEASSHHKAKQ